MAQFVTATAPYLHRNWTFDDAWETYPWETTVLPGGHSVLPVRETTLTGGFSAPLAVRRSR